MWSSRQAVVVVVVVVALSCALAPVFVTAVEVGFLGGAMGGLSTRMNNVYAGRGKGRGRYRGPKHWSAFSSLNSAPSRYQMRNMEATNTGQGCDLNYISLKKQGEGEGLAFHKALYHIGWYTGLNECQYCQLTNPHFENEMDNLPAIPNSCRQDNALQGVMMNPHNLPIRQVDHHFFSCMDGRAEYAILGTPGGDLGEFIRAIQAVEKLVYRFIDFDEVDSLLRRFLESMSDAGRHYFAMCTDETSKKAMYEAAKVKEPLNPLDADGRRRLLRVSAQPESVGSSHLKNMMEGEETYEVRKAIVESAIQSFHAIYTDWFNPLRSRLLYVMLRGERKEEAVISVNSPEACHQRVPMIVPRLHTVFPTSGRDIFGSEAGEAEPAVWRENRVI